MWPNLAPTSALKPWPSQSSSALSGLLPAGLNALNMPLGGAASTNPQPDVTQYVKVLLEQQQIPVSTFMGTTGYFEVYNAVSEVVQAAG